MGLRYRHAYRRHRCRSGGLATAVPDIDVAASGVVSGPTIMALADACMFAVVLSAIGKVKLAVTTSRSISIPPSPADLLAEGTMLRLGTRLAVMQVMVHSDGHDEPVAHATGTYSIPPLAGSPE